MYYVISYRYKEQQFTGTVPFMIVYYVSTYVYHIRQELKLKISKITENYSPHLLTDKITTLANYETV